MALLLLQADMDGLLPTGLQDTINMTLAGMINMPDGLQVTTTSSTGFCSTYAALMRHFSHSSSSRRKAGAVALYQGG
jgi:hypothetical protein